MTNIEVISISLAVFSVSSLLGIVCLILHDRFEHVYLENKFNILRDKLRELHDCPVCGDRFDTPKYISVEWLLSYIDSIDKNSKSEDIKVEQN